MLSAIVASTGAAGTRTKPRVAAASVMLCASVNAVTVASSLRTLATSSSRHSTNSRWSAPDRMCSTPSPTIGRAAPSSGPAGPAPRSAGCDGVRRALLHRRRRRVSIRTSTSVIVASSPSMRDRLAPPGSRSQRSSPCSMKAPPACTVVGSPTSGRTPASAARCRGGTRRAPAPSRSSGTGSRRSRAAPG